MEKGTRAFTRTRRSCFAHSDAFSKSIYYFICFACHAAFIRDKRSALLCIFTRHLSERYLWKWRLKKASTADINKCFNNWIFSRHEQRWEINFAKGGQKWKRFLETSITCILYFVRKITFVSGATCLLRAVLNELRDFLEEYLRHLGIVLRFERCLVYHC